MVVAFTPVSVLSTIRRHIHTAERVRVLVRVEGCHCHKLFEKFLCTISLVRLSLARWLEQF